MPARKPSELLTQEHMDIAASIQAVLEEVVLRLTRSVAEETGVPNLCMAGGVALNCVANGKVLRDGRFKNLWVQPASGDAGGALGAALAASHGFHNEHRQVTPGDAMKGSYLGPCFSQEEIERRLTDAGARFHTYSDCDVIAASACAMSQGRRWGGFRAGWSSVRELWALGPFWGMRDRPPCRVS